MLKRTDIWAINSKHSDHESMEVYMVSNCIKHSPGQLWSFCVHYKQSQMLFTKWNHSKTSILKIPTEKQISKKLDNKKDKIESILVIEQLKLGFKALHISASCGN